MLSLFRIHLFRSSRSPLRVAVQPLLILLALAPVPSPAAAADPPAAASPGRSTAVPLAIPLNTGAGATEPVSPQPMATPAAIAPVFNTPASSPSAAPTAPTAPTAIGSKPSGKVTIDSDLQQADQATGIVTATGNVRILYPDKGVVATARQAQYFTKEDRVVLSGDVDVIQEGGNHLRAERVVYLIKADRVIAEPAAGQQVSSKMVIQPRSTAPAGPSVGPSRSQTP